MTQHVSNITTTTPATVDTVETVLDQLLMDQNMTKRLLDDALLHFDEEGYMGVELEIEDKTLEIELEENSTIGDVYRLMIDELENYVEFDAYDDSDELKHKDELQQRFYKIAASLREDAEMQPVTPPKSFAQRIEEAVQQMYTPKSSALGNDEDLTEDTMSRLIEDHDLSHGNFEIDEDEEEIVISIEAPNHTTFTVYHHTKEDGCSIGSLRENMHEQIDEFVPRDEFDDIWSDQFGKHNGFTADGFYVLLHAAGVFFQKTVEDMMKDCQKR